MIEYALFTALLDAHERGVDPGVHRRLWTFCRLVWLLNGAVAGIVCLVRAAT